MKDTGEESGRENWLESGRQWLDITVCSRHLTIEEGTRHPEAVGVRRNPSDVVKIFTSVLPF